jgi:hypothetical protein
MIAAVPGEDLHKSANGIQFIQHGHIAVNRFYMIERPVRALRCTTSRRFHPCLDDPHKHRAGDASARLPARGRATANTCCRTRFSSGEICRTLRWQCTPGPTVFSNSGMSLKQPGIGNAKRVDPL